MNNTYLAHYGVKGQRWGVRKYQNEDGSLTPAGREHYGYSKKEIREDNRKAFEYGKNATISGKALARSMKQTIKAENKYKKALDKYGDTGSKKLTKLGERLDIETNVTRRLAQEYAANRDIAEKHCQELIAKYGSENVKGIKYSLNKNKAVSVNLINERVESGKDYAMALMVSIGSASFAALGAPAMIVQVPASAEQRGNHVYNLAVQEERMRRKQSQI